MITRMMMLTTIARVLLSTHRHQISKQIMQIFNSSTSKSEMAYLCQKIQSKLPRFSYQMVSKYIKRWISWTQL